MPDNKNFMATSNSLSSMACVIVIVCVCQWIEMVRHEASITRAYKRRYLSVNTTIGKTNKPTNHSHIIPLAFFSHLIEVCAFTRVVVDLRLHNAVHLTVSIIRHGCRAAREHVRHLDASLVSFREKEREIERQTGRETDPQRGRWSDRNQQPQSLRPFRGFFEP